MPAGDFTIAVLDGPVQGQALAPFLLRPPVALAEGVCSDDTGSACHHGTFVIGLLGASADAPVPGLCPDARLMHVPLFNDRSGAVTIADLSRAIDLALEAGAHIINLSLAIVRDTLTSDRILLDALDRALAQDVLVVAAAGNQRRFVTSPLLAHPATVPVVASHRNGNLLQVSNLAPSIARRGVAALGDDVASYAPDGTIVRWSGTSVAAAMATGIIASAWLMRPALTARQIRGAVARLGARRGLVPPQLTSSTFAIALACPSGRQPPRRHRGFSEPISRGAFA